MSVLVIDNDDKILDGMAALLKNWGCLVSTTRTGEEALRIATEAVRGPDVVLADYHLDTGNGLDAVLAIRSAIDPSLPAILITADRTEAIKSAATGVGVAVLGKPIKPAALRALIAQAGAQRLAAE